MKPNRCLIPLLVLALGGCASGPWHRLPNRPDTRLSNAAEYDAYVDRRTRELTAGGQTSGQASMIANHEATARFGERIDAGATNTAHVSWTNAKSGQDVPLADLDRTVDAMKKK